MCYEQNLVTWQDERNVEGQGFQEEATTAVHSWANGRDKGALGGTWPRDEQKDVERRIEWICWHGKWQEGRQKEMIASWFFQFVGTKNKRSVMPYLCRGHTAHKLSRKAVTSLLRWLQRTMWHSEEKPHSSQSGLAPATSGSAVHHPFST